MKGLDAALLGALATVLAAAPALSCAFHGVKPARTVIDWLLEADGLALARPSPGDAYAFSVVETLRAGGPDAIEAFVDTGARSRLRADPDAAVLFVVEAGGDWRAAALIDARRRRVIDAALAAAPEWGSGFGPERLAFAAALQDDPDPALAELAISEFDKAPYALLRTLELRIPPERLIADLWTSDGYPYQQTRALLLGIAGGAAARAEIRAFLTRTRDWPWAENLGAFAAALVELEGAAGVAWLEAEYLARSDQPLDKIGQIVGALALHGAAGDPALRDPVAAAAARLLASRPEAAVAVAGQFLDQGDWTQAASLSVALRMSPAMEIKDRFRIVAYLAAAHRAARPSQ